MGDKMVDGILVVNKPVGMTSFDVVVRLRHHLGQKKDWPRGDIRS